MDHANAVSVDMKQPVNLHIRDTRPTETAVRKRMKRDDIAGMLQAIVVMQDRIHGEGSYEAICTGVFVGDRLMTFYQTHRNGTLRRVKSRHGRFERTYLYAGLYRMADPLDFDRAGVGWHEMEACA